MAKNQKPSKRKELEITDLLNSYLKKKQLKVQLLGRGNAWLDTGTYESLLDASHFIKIIEERQNLKIGCVEEIAYKMKYIDKTKLLSLAREYPTSYGAYLKSLVS